MRFNWAPPTIIATLHRLHGTGTLVGIMLPRPHCWATGVGARVSRETGRTVELVSCYEAGYDGFWLHRQLEAHGIAISLLIRQACRLTGGRDEQRQIGSTERLLRSLIANLRGEPKAWSVVRVPSVAEEDARRLHRERDRLVSERVQHVNRIKGLCALQGIYDYHPLRPQAMGRLDSCAQHRVARFRRG